MFLQPLAQYSCFEQKGIQRHRGKLPVIEGGAFFTLRQPDGLYKRPFMGIRQAGSTGLLSSGGSQLQFEFQFVGDGGPANAIERNLRL